MTVEVRHSSRPDCVQLAALVAMVLRCESVADPPEGDDGSVRVLVSGKQVGAVYLGQTPRTDEWITRMAASLARSVTGAAAGFGGQGDVPTLHAAHGLERFDAAAFGRVRTAARERDRRRRTEASGLPVPATTTDTTITDDRGGGVKMGWFKKSEARKRADRVEALAGLLVAYFKAGGDSAGVGSVGGFPQDLVTALASFIDGGK